MRKIENLVHITGGIAGSHKKISDVNQLLQAIEENPALSQAAIAMLENPELINALSNPTLMSLLSDTHTLNGVFDIINRLDPQFQKNLPKEIARAQKIGLL